MKTINLSIIIFFLSVFSLQAQKKEVITTSFKVEGICGMCKERIENALSFKGIKAAEWNQETQICQVTYRSDKITIEEIHNLLNKAGHDTEKSKASDEDYATVHECCKYREDHSH